MLLSLGSRSYDLTTHALVMGAVGRAGLAAVLADMADMADIVEVVDVADVGTWAPVVAAVCVAPPDEAGLGAALAAGASIVRLGGGSAAAYRLCAAAGAAVVVTASAAPAVQAAGVGADRIVVDTGEAGGLYPLLVDVTGAAFPMAAAAAAVVRGARIVRTSDVRGARRVCDVLAAVMDTDR